MLPVGPCLEVINRSNGRLLGRTECFYFADRSALGLSSVVLIEHVDWGLKLLHLESIGQVASMLIVERRSWGLLDLIIGKGLHIFMNNKRFYWSINNMV